MIIVLRIANPYIILRQITNLPQQILKVFVIVTFGIGAFFQSSNARPRGDDCGSISLLISELSCSFRLYTSSRVLSGQSQFAKS